MDTGTTKTIEVFKNWEVVKIFKAPIMYADVDEDWAKWDCLFHFRDNRSYRLPKDLDFWSWDLFDEYNNSDYEPSKDDYDYEDWKYNKERYEEMIKKLDDEYYWQWLDWYEHSAVAISIAWTWIQCRRDTSNRVWIVAVPKKYFDLNQMNIEEKAYEYLKNAVDDYSDCFNGWVYESCLTEEVEFKNDDYWTITKDITIDDTWTNWYTMRTEDNMEDELIGFAKMICKDREIEYDDIKID